MVWIGHTLHLGYQQFHDELVFIDEQPNKCSDGTKALKEFCLTKHGQPINIYEYSIRLARGPNTHVIRFLDFQTKHIGDLKRDHIDDSGDFWEMTLDNHEAETRCLFLSHDIDQYCHSFGMMKKIDDQQVFIFPDNFE